MFDEMLVRVIFEFLLLWFLRLLVMLLRLLSFCIFGCLLLVSSWV
ncbi:hypothetical protein Patl1_09249 [Pistacia atlantica]|uniref:Uncharacterized protein n=1 Tax=Pistacia atlantica TaxID=434234 RepID=A0ACC1AIY6_9ROSI|nr:hypothetical protein Patl1_09249 [Pistacia atlantica]